MVFEQVAILEDGWSEWVQPVAMPRVYKMSCCDCGLVHDFVFKVVCDESTEGVPRTRFRVRRNNRATGQKRYHAIRDAEGVFARCGAVVKEVRRMLKERADGV